MDPIKQFWMDAYIAAIRTYKTMKVEQHYDTAGGNVAVAVACSNFARSVADRAMADFGSRRWER